MGQWDLAAKISLIVNYNPQVEANDWDICSKTVLGRPSFFLQAPCHEGPV